MEKRITPLKQQFLNFYIEALQGDAGNKSPIAYAAERCQRQESWGLAILHDPNVKMTLMSALTVNDMSLFYLAHKLKSILDDPTTDVKAALTSLRMGFELHGVVGNNRLEAMTHMPLEDADMTEEEAQEELDKYK